MYKEILVYTGTGDTARRMSEYAAAFAAVLKARLSGLVVEIDFIDYSEIERAITGAERKSNNADLMIDEERAGRVFDESVRCRTKQDLSNPAMTVGAHDERPNLAVGDFDL